MRLPLLVGCGVLVLVANVAVSILYMVIYGHLIDPGHDEQYYRDHVQVAAPYSSILAGIPLMFMAGWLAGRRWKDKFAIKAAITIWLTYALIDIAVLLTAGTTRRVAVFSAISLATKLVAVYLGAVVGRGRSNSDE